MTARELAERLNAVVPAGRFSVAEDGRPCWASEFEAGEGEEPHDVAWEEYCEVSDFMRAHAPGWVVCDYWSDPDSHGFALRPE